MLQQVLMSNQMSVQQNPMAQNMNFNMLQNQMNYNPMMGFPQQQHMVLPNLSLPLSTLDANTMLKDQNKKN